MTNELINSDKQRKRRAWPEKRRKALAQRNRKNKPWEASTGPRTAEGKAASSQNAYRHGFRSRDMDEIAAILREQRRMVRDLLSRHCSQNVVK